MTGTAPTPQLRLPGQAHVAEGPHDQTGMYVMHFAFRRDLDDFVVAVRQTPLGEAEVWAALQRRWQAFAEALHHHHSLEDASIWPVMLAHADREGRAEDRALLEAMDAEHDEIDPGLAACADGFAQMVSHSCGDHRNALDVRLTGLREVLAEHLAHEETEALPLLQRTLTAEEWAVCERAAGKGYPVRSVPFLISWTLKNLPPDAHAFVMTGAGPAFRLLHRLTRHGFERRERVAFRYV